MFDNLNPQQNNQGQGGRGAAEDIFAGIDNEPIRRQAPLNPINSQVGVQAGVSKPSQFQSKAAPMPYTQKQAAPKFTAPAANTLFPGQEAEPADGNNNGDKKYIIIGMAAIIILVIILISMIALAYYKVGSTETSVNQTPAETTIDNQGQSAPVQSQTGDINKINSENSENNTNNAEILPTEENQSGEIKPAENNATGEPADSSEVSQEYILDGITDSDKDGLTDGEEKRLGTDPNNVDTDEDGLFDREEIKVYKTDPKNPDTDGDGYTDGAEVKNGYNPNGSGKLYELP